VPALAVIVIIGSVFLALLFFADATLKHAMRTKNGSPVTSQRIGLSAPRSHDAIKTLNAAPAPAPDMTSEAVLAAQPKSARDALATIESAAREARAEAPPKKARPKEPPQKVRGEAKNAWAEAPLQNRPVTQSIKQSQFDRFSIKGY
jgi:hypothetical protein